MKDKITHLLTSELHRERMHNHERSLTRALENYGLYEHHYKGYDFKRYAVIARAKSHALLEVIIHFSYSRVDREILFRILSDEEAMRVNSLSHEAMIFDNGEFIPSHVTHLIPLSSQESFRRYIQRARKRGIKNTLIHNNRGRTRSKSKWTQILKDIVILFAVKKTTHCSSNEIYEDLEMLLLDFPDIVKRGVSLVKPSTIRRFLNNEGQAYISYAKDNKLEFQRKIIGTLRFLPPSAPLVRVGIDGYIFQLICADDETHKPTQFVAVIIYDYQSKAVLGVAFGKTESSATFREAWRDYFKNTNNKLPREVVMDRFSAHTSSKVFEINKLFHKHSVIVKRSSNANNNSRLERFFRTLQEYQSSVLQSSFVGYSIVSRGINARPSRTVAMKLRKKAYLKSESELKHHIKFLLLDIYNKQHIYKSYSPLELFNRGTNHHATISQLEVAVATWEQHKCTIVGCGVYIKSGEHLYLYKNRSFNVATQYFKHAVCAFINPSNLTSDAIIYSRENGKYLCNMQRIAVVPCSLFDRTNEQKQFIRDFNKETRNLIHEIAASLTIIETNVENFFAGADILQHRKAAKIKKLSDTAFIQAQIGLQDIKPEPQIEYANLGGKSKKFSRTRRTDEEALATKYQL